MTPGLGWLWPHHGSFGICFFFRFGVYATQSSGCARCIRLVGMPFGLPLQFEAPNWLNSLYWTTIVWIRHYKTRSSNELTWSSRKAVGPLSGLRLRLLSSSEAPQTCSRRLSSTALAQLRTRLRELLQLLQLLAVTGTQCLDAPQRACWIHMNELIAWTRL